MQYDLYYSLWIFFIYSFLGWSMEVVHFAVTRGKFVNRGFLTGPACPVYGFGVLFVLQALSPWYDQPVMLFVGSVIITTAVEYFIGWLTEKVVHQRLWDYSDYPFNIRGYICLRSSLLWGLLCLFVVDMLHPALMRLVGMVPQRVGGIALCIIGAGFLTDLIITGREALKIPSQLKAAEEAGRMLLAVSDGLGESLADRVFETRDKLEELRQKYPELDRRLSAYEERRPLTKAELEERLESYRAALSRRNNTMKRWGEAYPRFDREQLRLGMDKLREYYQEKKAERK